MMMAAVGCLTYEFQVSLPVMASHALHAGATGFGFMTAAMGVGAVAGGLFVAARGRTGIGALTARCDRVRGRRWGWRRSPRAWRVELIAAGARRRGEHLVHVDRQLDAAADGRARHARPRDGAVVRRLPGLDPDRRPDRRRDDGACSARAPGSASARSRAWSSAAAAALQKFAVDGGGLPRRSLPRVTRARARDPVALAASRAPSSASSSRSARSSPPGSAGSKYAAASPPVSGSAVARAASTGVPRAIASSTTRPKPSYRLGWTSREAPRISASSRASET